MRKYTSLLFFIALISVELAAQTTPTSNYNNWFTYFAQYKLSKHWAVHLDVQFRADNKVQQINQSLLRTGAQYFIRPDLSVTLGYAYINTYSQSASGYFMEHRIWEQLLYNHTFGKVNMTHRLRLEQRFVENLATETDDYNSGHRVRYFNRTVFPLGNNQNDRAAPYIALQDEIFINFAASDINDNVFDQNRLLIALGILHRKHTRLEIGYMNQRINPATGADVTNHILHLSILQALDFGTP